MLLKLKTIISEKLYKEYGVNVVVEIPKKEGGDLSVPLFRLAKEKNIKINELALEVINILSDEILISNCYFDRGFLNININKEKFSEVVLKEVLSLGNNYGSIMEKDKIVVIDYSSPNIAKNFSVGHLRSTVIGASLAKIYDKLGYKVIGINHLGDWGTQFGKMIVAYKLWGNEKDLEENPIDYLQSLYVKFHSLEDESLEDEARLVFKELEEGNEEYTSLWEKFKKLSLVSFDKMYKLLDVTFDYYTGESFYNDKMERVVKELDNKALTKIDDGALIVNLDEYNMPPALIKRSDGATLYMTRDLAALLYRYETFNFDRILYVVGNEQKLHFSQLKEVAKLMGYDFDLNHVNFGLILKDGKKMTTRGGNVVKLEDVISEAISLASEQIMLKNPALENKEEVAKNIAISAIIFNDLKNDRNLDIEFDLEEMLSFEGLTGPYLQYSSVRITSIIKDYQIKEEFDYSLFNDDLYFGLIKEVASFKEVLNRALVENGPQIISRYALNLAQTFNRFYNAFKVLVEDETIKNTNLSLIFLVRVVLDECMRLLNMKILKEM